MIKMKTTLLYFRQGYHFMLISKICAFVIIVLENLNVLVSKKCAYFGVKCLVFINIVYKLLVF